MLNACKASATLLLSIMLLGAKPASVVAQQSLPFAPSSTRPLDLADSEYVLGPGDQIAIAVLGYEEFTGTNQVLPDGTISVPVLGPVMAADHTIGSLTQELTVKLNQLLIDPSVTVRLVAPREVIVTVSGEVLRPGPIQLQAEDSTALTLGSALALAGGVTRNANIRQVVLTRQMPGSAVSSTTINLWDTIWTQGLEDAPTDSASAPGIVLRDGDAIYIPTLTESDELDQRLIAQSSYAPDTVRVRVVGEVKSPGEVLVSPSSSISSAVAIAGGPTEDASLQRVEFIRLSEEGVIESQDVDLRSLTDEFQVQEGDVVIVPRQNSSSILNWAGRILGPFGDIINILDRL